MQKFDQASSYRLSKETLATKTEIKIFSRVYLIAGIHLEAYPENFAFEICARLVSLFGTKPNTTRLIKQADEYSAQHGGLVVPYVQLQPPGSGLVFSMHMHTASVVDMDFTDAQMTSISLSDRIIVLNMSTVKIMSNINLPVLDEPYLNSTTLTRAFSADEKGHVTSTVSTTTEEPQHFKKFLFLVNSLHHTYLVNTQEHIKFERSSKTGFRTIEFVDEEHGLCVLAEIDGHSVECWNIITNRLFGRIDFPSAAIKNVRCVCVSRLIVTLLEDGSIHYHAIRDHTSSTFVHCCSTKANPHLDSIYVIGQLLFCTFDTVTPIDFAVINLRPLAEINQIVRDEEILKTLMTFDPPITAVHPIKRIEVPNDNEPESKREQKGLPFFAALTSESLYLVHQCKNDNISYLKIDGEYDVVYLHVSHQYCMYTARGCIIDMYKWACIQPHSTEAGNHPCLHRYQLYVSIDVNSAPVTTITASSDGCKTLV